MRRAKALLSILPLLLLLAISCNNKLKIEKRKYRSGFHIEWSGNIDSRSATKIKPIQAKESKSIHRDLQIIENHDTNRLIVSEFSSLENKNQSHYKNWNKKLKYSSIRKNETLDTEERSSTKKNPTLKKSVTQNDENDLIFAAVVSLIAFSCFKVWKLILGKSAEEHRAYAFENKKNARWGIAKIHLLTVAIAWIVASLFNKNKIPFEFLSNLSIGIIFFSLISTYINKKNKKNKKINKTIRQGNIFLMLIGGFLGSFLTFHSGPLHSYTPDVVLGNSNEFFQIVGKILLGLILLAALIGAWYLLAVSACNLACSGYVVAAYLLFYGGGTILNFLFLLGILNLFKKKMGSEAEKLEQKREITILSLIISISLLFTLLLLELVL